MVASWPKKRGRPKSPITREQNAEFKRTMEAIKYLPGIIQTPHIEATQGLALLPRDTMTMMLYGTLFAVQFDDGRKIYPMAARETVSDSLDILSQVEGTILYRGPDFWMALPPGPSGAYLRMDPATDLPMWQEAPPPVVQAYWNRNHTQTVVNPTPVAATSVISVAIPAAAVARTFAVSGMLTWNSGTHGMRGAIMVDGAVVWPVLTPAANSQINGIATGDGAYLLTFAGVLIDIPGDSAAHTIELAWAAQASTAGVTLQERAIIAIVV